MTTIVCRICNVKFEHSSRGRPPVKCLKCKGSSENININFSSNPSNVKEDTVSINTTTSTATTTTAIPSDSKESPQVETRALVEELATSLVRFEAEPLGNYEFEVFVSNLGYVYRGDEENKATKVFKIYQQKSEQGFGQVGYETVSFYNKGTLVVQHLHNQKGN